MRRKVARVLFCASLCLSLLAFAGCSAESTTGGASDNAPSGTPDNASTDVAVASGAEEFDGVFDATVNAEHAGSCLCKRLLVCYGKAVRITAESAVRE